MYNSVRKDLLISQAFKKDFGEVVGYIDAKLKDSSLENLKKDNYHLELIDHSLDGKFKSPEILFTEKISDSVNEFTVFAKIPVKNPNIFEKIFPISLNDKNFDKSILTEFKSEYLIFTGKSNVILAKNPDMIEKFKIAVEKNVAIFNNDIEVYTKVYNDLKAYIASTFLNRVKQEIERIENISKNKESLNNW